MAALKCYPMISGLTMSLHLSPSKLWKEVTGGTGQGKYSLTGKKRRKLKEESLCNEYRSMSKFINKRTHV